MEIGVELELVFIPFGIPALVKPVQPAIDDAVKSASMIVSKESGARSLRDILE